MRRTDALLLAIALAVAALPLALAQAGALPAGSSPTFAGADDQARALVGQVSPGYRPWRQPVWTPPSGEIASLLFAAQAGLGCGFIGYYFGRRGAANRGRENPGEA